MQIRDFRTAILEDLDAGDETADATANDPKSLDTSSDDLFTNLKSKLNKAKKQYLEEKEEKKIYFKDINNHDIENMTNQDDNVDKTEEMNDDCEEVRRIIYNSSEDEQIHSSSQTSNKKRHMNEDESLPRKCESHKRIKTTSRYYFFIKLRFSWFLCIQ